MASSRNNTTIGWNSGNSTYSLAAATTYTSDAFTYNVEDWAAGIQLKADNSSGSPASGDVIEWSIAYSADGTNYDTTEHATPIGRCDTVSANTPGEDPAVLSVPIETAFKSFKVVARNRAASNAITISAIVVTQRPQ